MLPSLPGYGFSGEPAELGWNVGRVARAWAELMHRLGYTRYVAQGGDVGAAVTDAMGRQAPEGLLGIHIELARDGVGRPPTPAESEEERAAADAARHIQGERLRLLPGDGHASADDRLRPAGFTRRPGRLAARPRHGQLLQDLPRLRRRRAGRAISPGTHIVDNITLYWLTGTGASAARSYWEDGQALLARAAGQAPPKVSLPVGFTTFPGEIWRTPRSWVENSYPNVTYFNEVDKGGHFAAWEEPQLFSEEMRAAFRSVR